MRILVDLGHPGHVHFYKYAVQTWHNHGHKVLITARDKDVTLSLLKHYHLDYHVLSSASHGRPGLAAEFVQREWNLWRVIREFRPDVVTAIGGVFIAPVCKLISIPSVVFTDSEHVYFDRYLTYPLASVVCTPYCFKKQAGSRHVRYRGFQELAYLHPNYFTPDPTMLAELDLTPKDRFVLLRFVGWGATHDIGHFGFTDQEKSQLGYELSKQARVLVSTEGRLLPELQPYAVSIPPEKIHDLLYYASLYVGEGATMATEAGLLGTPAIYVSSLVGTMGNFEELARYGLMEAYRSGATGVQRAVEIMGDLRTKSSRQDARQRMLNEMSNVTAFLIRTVESYGRGESIG